jgi:hypothetical protein
MAGISLTRVTANLLKSNIPVYREEPGTDPDLSAEKYPNVYRLRRVNNDELPQLVRLRRDFGEPLPYRPHYTICTGIVVHDNFVQ